MASNEKYIRPEEVCRIFQVTPNTLRRWNNEKRLEAVRTKGGHRRYELSSVLRLKAQDEGKEWKETEKEGGKTRRKICYARVGTASQKKDLETQVEFFRGKYPNYECLSDVGSGLNFKRKRFLSILDDAVRGNIEEVVVTHKDRLCRFGFELVERVLGITGGKIVVLNQEVCSPEQELVGDLLSITTVFSARLYGLRSHSLRRKIRDANKAGAERKEPQNSPDEVLSE